MTLVATTRANAVTSGSGVGSVVSGSFTPAANARLYVAVWAEQGSGSSYTLTISDTANLFSGGAATPIVNRGPQGSFASRLYVWEVLTGQSPSSMTVTITSVTNNSFINYEIFDVAGNTPARVSGQLASNIAGDGFTGAGATASTGTLPAAATSGNLTVIIEGANRDSQTSLSLPSGFSALGTPQSGTFELMNVGTSTTFAATSTTYSNASDNENYGNAIFEISEGVAPVVAVLLETGSAFIALEDGTRLIMD